MNISIFGVGYVGLVTAACFAEMGNDVVCVDVDAEKIRCLAEGRSPIYEPGLEELLRRNLREQRLSFTTDARLAVEEADLLFIAVGTPSDSDGSADLQYVLQVATAIADSMTSDKLVVIKSTVPIGTAGKVKRLIAESLERRGLPLRVDVASNPEFLKEGSAVDDCLKPSRVVIGTGSERAGAVLRRLYEPFVRNGNPILLMDTASSEMTKYAANAMLATKISFMNELARLCEKTGADVEKVRQGIGSDPRIGYSFIYPGLGYGGSCFPKDVKALIRIGHGQGEDMRLLQAVDQVNVHQRLHFIDKLKAHFVSGLQGKRIALWGLSFKPGTDDIREAPSLSIIRALLGAGATVTAFDPIAMEPTRDYFGVVSNLVFAASQYEALLDADALCIMTEWKSFREPNFDKMRSMMRIPQIFDGRNLYEPRLLAEKGFGYVAIGRPEAPAVLVLSP